jgi:hypothetical protein
MEQSGSGGAACQDNGWHNAKGVGNATVGYRRHGGPGFSFRDNERGFYALRYFSLQSLKNLFAATAQEIHYLRTSICGFLVYPIRLARLRLAVRLLFHQGRPYTNHNNTGHIRGN